MFKRHKIAFAFVLFFPFFLLLIAWPWMKVSYHRTLPIHITTATGIDFSWPSEEGYDIQNAQVGCLSGSPYIYIVKRKTILEQEMDSQHEMTLNLIDIEKGVRILQANWINENSMSGCLACSVSQAFAILNQPYIILHRFQLDLPYYFRFLNQSMLQSMMERYGSTNTCNQFFILDGSGQLIENNHCYPYKNNPLPGRVAIPAVDEAKKEFAEYLITSSRDIRQTLVWKGAGIPNSCFPLQDGSYYGTVNRRNPGVSDTDKQSGIMQQSNTRVTHTFFLHTDPPSYRDFTPEELKAIHPKSSDDQGVPHFNLLSGQANQPYILFDTEDAFYFPARQNPFFPIYEIQVEKIANGTPKDIFKVIGTSTGKYPLAVLHDNTALILYNQPTSPLNQSKPVFLSLILRDRNPDGSLGSFGSEIKEFPVSGMIQPKVLDSERLIFIRDNALWTVQWDGSGEIRVFPRK